MPTTPTTVLLDKRPPMLRRAKDTDRMNLPEGKTCADCVHCRRCCSIFGHIPADEVCDWSPSRFAAAPAPGGEGETNG
jgi:hypothetical protein